MRDRVARGAQRAGRRAARWPGAGAGGRPRCQRCRPGARPPRCRSRPGAAAARSRRPAPRPAGRRCAARGPRRTVRRRPARRPPCIRSPRPSCPARRAGRARPPRWPQPLPGPAQRAVADRLLDEPPGQRGQPDAGRGLDQRPGAGPPSQLAGVVSTMTGIMPQVDAVGPDADPAQRPPAQHQADQAARAGGGGHDRRRGHRQQHQPAAGTVNGEYWPTRQIISADHGQPGNPGAVQQDAGRDRPRAGRRLGHTMASAAPISSPQARVSEPS